MKLKPKKRLSSIVGLKLNDGLLHACRAARAKGGVEITKTATAPLSLDLLHPDPELVGREIKNHLDAAGIRERHAIVAVPARWVMTLQTRVPELAAEDTASFLQLEAEKGFPVDPEHLQIARSFQRTAVGTFVTQLAVRKDQLEQLTGVLKAAGIKPVSYALGLATLPGAVPPAGSGRITIAVAPAGVTMLFAAAGGIAAFRTCEASIETEAGEKLVNTAAIARELRITFEQLPPELRGEIKQLLLTGDSTMVRQLAEGVADWAKVVGLALDRSDLPEKNYSTEIAKQIATHWLEAGAIAQEFLPPRPSRWAQFMSRYSSKRLATASFAAAAVAVLALGAFGWLEFRRLSLRSEWGAIQTQVTALQSVQDRIREFRPFYDTSFRTLTILKRVTECFPDTGTVTAKIVEVHGNAVSITGTARDKPSALRVQEQLRKIKEIQGVKIEQMRGQSPVQFNLVFRWNPNPTGS